MSTIVDNGSTKRPIPNRESHVCPLLQLQSAQQQTDVWRRAVDTHGQNITAKKVDILKKNFHLPKKNKNFFDKRAKIFAVVSRSNMNNCSCWNQVIA
jgi:hypothetical protein